jgi:predicted nucleotidyltransferase
MEDQMLPDDFKEFLRLLNARAVDIDGVKVNLISLVDLRTNKRASGRHKDLDDLEHLPEV